MRHEIEEQLSGKTILVVAIVIAVLLAPIGVYFRDALSRGKFKAQYREYAALQRQAGQKQMGPRKNIARIAQGQSGHADFVETETQPTFDCIWMVSPATGIGGNNNSPTEWHVAADGKVIVPETQPSGVYYAYHANATLGEANSFDKYEFQVVERQAPTKPFRASGQKKTARSKVLKRRSTIAPSGPAVH